MLVNNRFLILVTVAWVSASCWCSGPAAAQSQTEMNSDAQKSYEKADAALNQVYKQILLKYKKDKTFLQKLAAAERAWVTFRDAHVESRFPEPDKSSYGSVYPMCRATLLAEITNDRVRQLRKWLEGTQEGDVCAGSIQAK